MSCCRQKKGYLEEYMEHDLFEVICWPDIQFLFGIEGFWDNAYLVNDERGIEDYGSSAFFVRSNWLNEHVSDIQI